MSLITISGSKIYYEKAGSGEPIIFLHADALDHRQWDTQAAYFSQKYTVFSLDIRGFGKSDVPTDASYSFSEDLLALIDALSIQKTHLVGLSLGSAIAIDFALTHADRVLSLVLADSGIAGDGFSEPFIANIRSIVSKAKNHDLAGAKKEWLSLSIFDYSRKYPDVWKQIELMVDNTSGYRWFGANQPIDIDPPAAARLSDIHVPTLVLVGEHDIEDFQRKSKLLHEKISGSKFVIISGAGHLSNMDNPEAFNQTVQKFFDGIITS